MFDNIALFAKPNHLFSTPGLHWTTRTKIYCTCELPLGLGHVLKWDKHSGIRLNTLIKFYKQLSDSTLYNKEPTTFTFVYKGSPLVFSWQNNSWSDAVLRVTYYQLGYSGTTEHLLLEKKLHQYTFKLAHSFFLQIMQILTQHTSAEVCTYYGEMMGLGQGIPPFEFKVGERVTTVPGTNVKTQRTGYIITRSYHMNDKTNLYYLMVDGKILAKRYLPADLIKADVQEEQHKL